MKAADRYMKIVEWSEEDRCYVGTCPGLMSGGIHGSDERAVYAELCKVVDEWVRIQEEDGDPLPPPTAGKAYSGRFVLRVGPEMHKELALAALRAGESLNRYCVETLRDRARGVRQPLTGRPTRRGASSPK
jgi:predicted HicB family RNase H-like nuclease